MLQVIIILVFSPPQLFVGLSFPYEGPAPLEAIANGCAFLNPKFNPPKSSKNTDFFKGKPTLREVRGGGQEGVFIPLEVRLKRCVCFP